MNIKNILNVQNIVPGVLLLGALLLIFTGSRTAELPRGTAIFEKSSTGFSRITTLPSAAEATLQGLEGGYYRVRFKDPSMNAWISESGYTPGLQFPGDLILRARIGRMTPDFPPFRGHEVQRSFSVEGRTVPQRTTGMFFLYGGLLGVLALLTLKYQVVKNAVFVVLGFFFVVYALYAGGLQKSQHSDDGLHAVLVEPVLNSGSTNTVYTQNRTLYDFAAAHIGNRYRLEINARPGSIAGGFLLWRGNPGHGWRLLARHNQYSLYQK